MCEWEGYFGAGRLHIAKAYTSRGDGGDKWVPADWGNTPITPRLNMVVTPMLRFTHSSASGDGEARRQNATGKWAGR